MVGSKESERYLTDEEVRELDRLLDKLESEMADARGVGDGDYSVPLILAANRKDARKFLNLRYLVPDTDRSGGGR